MAKKNPVVSIVGRRNVGKSTLFNALVKKKIAIVDDHPGLTRDVISYRVTSGDRTMLLTDTPGLDLPSDAELSEPILKTAQKALEESDLIILLFENPGPDSFDYDLLDSVRKLGKPAVMAVNKMDSAEEYENMANFYELGVSELLPISAKKYSNVDMLIEKVAALLPPGGAQEEHPDFKLALVGKPNAGKSTLLNALLGYERSVVSEIPGTTRDSVNERFRFHEKLVEIVDTAGVRKKTKIKESVEFFSLTRTQRAIGDCDVVIHLVDAELGITDTDKKIADLIVKANRPLIIAVNKWDKLDKDTHTFKRYTEKLKHTFFRAGDFPIISISAKDKTRINKLMINALELFADSQKHVDTGELNRELERLQRTGRLPGFGQELKVFYATQMNMSPPTFKFFVNDPSRFRADVIRFFQKELQKFLGVKGIPINIKVEGRKSHDKNSARAKKKKRR